MSLETIRLTALVKAGDVAGIQRWVDEVVASAIRHQRLRAPA